jgi:hypothetical protein
MMMACVMLPMVTGGIISTVTRLADAHSADGKRLQERIVVVSELDPDLVALRSR